MECARAVATEILFMEHGRVIEQGSPAELLSEGAQTRTQDFCIRLCDLCNGDAVSEAAECSEA
jgi:polar amino acid transport system ATP-binding protein